MRSSISPASRRSAGAISTGYGSASSGERNRSGSRPISTPARSRIALSVGGVRDQAAGTHDRHEQRSAVVRARCQRQHSRRSMLPSDRVPPEHLLAAGPRRLALGALPSRPSVVFLQLVGAVEVRRVGRSVHPRADPEAVDRRVLPHEVAQPILVEVAAREDRDRRADQPRRGSRARAARARRVAAVDAHALDRDAVGRELRGRARPPCAPPARCRRCRSAAPRYPAAHARSSRTPPLSSACAWTYECAIVPYTGTPNCRAASTVAVPANPAM